ncbi:MAG: sialidase [Acidobacteriota bacterium]
MTSRFWTAPALGAGLLIVGLWGAVAPASGQGTPEVEAEGPAAADDPFQSLSFRHIGPLGNRVSAVVGVAGDPKTYYAGAATGGVWRSRDGGHGWRPIFDATGAASIGALAVAPSDAQVIWAGTGEAFIRSNVSIGNGVYRSTDGGETWHHRGLEDSGRIARILVHPSRPGVAWAAVLGHGYGPQEGRGVFKTKDGGRTWRHVLSVNAETGASDLVIDPQNPRHLFAGTWQFSMDGSGRTSGGPGSGLWRSRDAGETWTRVAGGGLPSSPWGKVGLAQSAEDPRRVYALIETSSNRDFAASEPYAGTLWRSTDGGAGWKMVNASNALHQRPLYYSRVVAAPDDADEVHFMAVAHLRSLDGGVSVDSLGSGWDHHDMWIDPLDPDRMIVGHDGGVSISIDRGENWYRPQLPIAQMYSVEVDDEVPYRVYGNRQDGAAMRGPSQTLAGGEIPLGAWRQIGGCEVGRSIPDRDDPTLVYSTCYDGILQRWWGPEGITEDISVWPEAIESWPASELRFRFTWDFPIAASPHASGRLYAGSHVVHQSDDRGETWRVVSPDLTSGDPALMQRRGGLTLDDAGPTVAPSLSSLVESPHRAGELWAGTNDGRLQRRAGEGEPWTDLTDRLPGLPKLGTISDIEFSPHAEDRIYVSVDRHRENDRRPWVYRTRDGGSTWTAIVEGLVGGRSHRGGRGAVFDYVHALVADPQRDGLLFAGTEGGLFFTLDDGDSWRPVDGGLPPAPVYDLKIQPRFGDLVVATYGRGFWILDDLSPIRQASTDGRRDTRLLTPRSAYRFRGRTGGMAQPDVPAAGANPPVGVPIHYSLTRPAASVSLEIVDAVGHVVRELMPPEPVTTTGIQRVWWDLHYDPTPGVRLRTPPDERPADTVPAEGFRTLRDGRPVRLLAGPGTYRVRLTVSSESGREAAAGEGPGEAVLEAELELVVDPASFRRGVTGPDFDRQYSALTELRDMAERAAAVINEIEWLRAELLAKVTRLEALEGGDGAARAEAVAKIRSLERAFADVEGRFFDLRMTDGSQDTLRWKRLLWARIGDLARRVGAADGAPTASQLEVLGELRGRLAEAEELFRRQLDEARRLGGELGASGLGFLAIATRDDAAPSAK